MKPFEIIKFVDGDFELNIKVSPDEQTLWLTQDQIAELFGKARSTITEHINNIFSEGELVELTSVGNSDRSTHRPAKLYNLDVVLAIGYRIKSNRGSLLRDFANDYFMSLCDTRFDSSKLIIYNNGEISVSVNASYEEETVYLNEIQIAILFETSRQNVNLHIQNIKKEGELSLNSVRKDFLHTAPDSNSRRVFYENIPNH